MLQTSLLVAPFTVRGVGEDILWLVQNGAGITVETVSLGKVYGEGMISLGDVR